ncbi:MAG: hypothetical protein ABDH20_02025 [Thermus sp.]
MKRFGPLVCLAAGAATAGGLYFLFGPGDLVEALLVALTTVFVAVVREPSDLVQRLVNSSLPLDLPRPWPGWPGASYAPAPGGAGWEAMPSQWERLGLWILSILRRALSILVFVLGILGRLLRLFLAGLLTFLQKFHAIPLALLVLLGDPLKLLVAGAALVFGLVAIKLLNVLLGLAADQGAFPLPWGGQTRREVRP